jgi:hypothetical protein
MAARCGASATTCLARRVAPCEWRCVGQTRGPSKGGAAHLHRAPGALDTTQYPCCLPAAVRRWPAIKRSAQTRPPSAAAVCCWRGPPLSAASQRRGEALDVDGLGHLLAAAGRRVQQAQLDGDCRHEATRCGGRRRGNGSGRQRRTSVRAARLWLFVEEGRACARRDGCLWESWCPAPACRSQGGHQTPAAWSSRGVSSGGAVAPLRRCARGGLCAASDRPPAHSRAPLSSSSFALKNSLRPPRHAARARRHSLGLEPCWEFSTRSVCVTLPLPPGDSTDPEAGAIVSFMLLGTAACAGGCARARRQ